MLGPCCTSVTIRVVISKGRNGPDFRIFMFVKTARFENWQGFSKKTKTGRFSACIEIKNAVIRRPENAVRIFGHTNGKVAQLVEQLAFNQLVLGSNPSLSTFFGA